MKISNSTSVIVIEKGIETSKRFEKQILDIFKKEANHSFYNKNDITITDIYIWDVSWGVGYGRFNKFGNGTKIIVKARNVEGNFEMTFDLYETIEAYRIDELRSLEYGFKPHSDAKKRIVISLLENEIENIFTKLTDNE